MVYLAQKQNVMDAAQPTLVAPPLRSHTKYMVTRLLESFTVYKLFNHGLSPIDMCPMWRCLRRGACLSPYKDLCRRQTKSG
jgi:hypothetical protein